VTASRDDRAAGEFTRPNYRPVGPASAALPDRVRRVPLPPAVRALRATWVSRNGPWESGLVERIRIARALAAGDTSGPSPAIRLPDGSSKRFTVTDLVDLYVLAQVFGDEEYREPALTEPKLIVDAGSHIGGSVRYFAARYPTARIIALEASPSTYAALKANTADLPQVDARHCALAPETGSITLFEYDGLSSSGSTLTGGEHGREIQVPAISLGDLLAELGEPVDLLKYDIEGAEFGVFTQDRPTPDRIRNLVGEMHDWLPHIDYTAPEFLALLGDYSRVDVDRSGNDPIVIARG
jgi:FkbM family methyltransferase